MPTGSAAIEGNKQQNMEEILARNLREPEDTVVSKKGYN
jgi:hypothetical protein